MSERSISFSVAELETLVKWINTLDPQPRVVKVTASPTGIGTVLRAEIETSEGEGRFKDLTDYDNW